MIYFWAAVLLGAMLIAVGCAASLGAEHGGRKFVARMKGLDP